jgi:hypothetical protein
MAVRLSALRAGHPLTPPRRFLVFISVRDTKTVVKQITQSEPEFFLLKDQLDSKTRTSEMEYLGQ